MQPKEKLEAIIATLRNELWVGWQAWCIAKELRTQYLQKDMKNAQWFFGGSYLSTLNAAFLALAHVVDKHEDAISICYLLKSARSLSSYQVFRSVRPKSDSQRDEKIKAKIEYCENRLKEIEPTVQSITEQRDRILAHLDRKNINDPTRLLADPIPSDKDIEHCFRVLYHIVDAYDAYLLEAKNPDISNGSFDTISERIKEDITYVIGLIDQDNQRP